MQAGFRRFFNKRTALFVTLIIIVASMAGISFRMLNHSGNPIPSSIRSSSSFSLYYPSSLPDGYSIKKGSFSQTAEVVTYYAQNKQGDKLFFSIQPMPDKTSLDDFNSRVLQNKVNVLSDAGTAAVGTLNGRATGSLVTTKSWVLVTSSQSSGEKTISTVLSNLKRE